MHSQTSFHAPGRVLASALLVIAVACASIARADQVRMESDGAVVVPSMRVPNTPLYSAEGHASRVEHVTTERSLKGRPIAELNAALFGPRLVRMREAYAVTVHDETIGGVHVRVYEPRDGISPRMRSSVLINVHGGGFVGCFDECGGLESVPIAALARARVVSIDYRLAPTARFPDASKDVEAVYRVVLQKTPASRIGLFGCSAGGALVAQSLAWFQHVGLPRPAAAGIYCAGASPFGSGDSAYFGLPLGDGDPPPAAPAAAASAPPRGYMQGTSTDDPLAYPAVDPRTLARFPPTLVVVGGRDFAFSQSVYLHSRLVAAGVDARLNVWEGARHAFFYDVRVPEAREAYAVMVRFFEEHAGRR